MIKILKYAPEVELLLCCAHSRLASQTAERVEQLIQAGLDWDYLLEISRRHKLKPLLYWHLNSTCPDAIPTTIWELLREYCQDNNLRNEFLTQELLNLLNLFESHHIPVIPYKGPILAFFTHGNLALRHWWDLDILVDEQSFEQTQELLISQGYRSEKQLDWEESFINENSRIEVDLHRRITPRYFPFKFDFQHFWQRSETRSVLGTDINILLPEDLLILLCVQVVKDAWENKIRLIKLCDIAEVICANEALEWEQVMEQASTLGCQRVLFLALGLTSELLGIVLPEVIIEKIRVEPVVKLYAERFRQRLFPKTEKRNSTKTKTPINWFTRQEERILLALPPYLDFIYYLAMMRK